MTQAQHTPGPWKAYTPGSQWIEGGGEIIAGAMGDNSQADARLIVAAPELVEALAYLLEQTIEQDERFGIALTEGEQEAADKARALLARINGEAV